MRRSHYRSILHSAPLEARGESTSCATPLETADGPGALLVLRARRLRRRGEQRRAMLILREACHTAENSARLWTLYAAQCMRCGRRDDAAEALTRAAWLRDRNRDSARARVTRELLERLAQGRFPKAA